MGACDIKNSVHIAWRDTDIILITLITPLQISKSLGASNTVHIVAYCALLHIVHGEIQILF